MLLAGLSDFNHLRGPLLWWEGWQSYNTMFCEQVVGNNMADWSKLNRSLYAVSFQQRGGVRSVPIDCQRRLEAYLALCQWARQACMSDASE